MNKSMKVTTQNPRILEQSNSMMTISTPKAIITSAEGWQITVACRNEDKTEDLEQAQLKVYLPKSKTLTCTIQDLSALHAILENACRHMVNYSMQKFADVKQETDVLDTTTELQNLLKLFE